MRHIRVHLRLQGHQRRIVRDFSHESVQVGERLFLAVIVQIALNEWNTIGASPLRTAFDRYRCESESVVDVSFARIVVLFEASECLRHAFGLIFLGTDLGVVDQLLILGAKVRRRDVQCLDEVIMRFGVTLQQSFQLRSNAEGMAFGRTRPRATNHSAMHTR